MPTIIVPLDGSQLSEQSLGLAGELATTLAGELLLVYALEDPDARGLSPRHLLLRSQAAAEHYLDHVAARLNGQRVSTFLLHGNPAEELLALTRYEPDSMVVMSTHGRGGLGRALLGSVSDKVLRGAGVPVAVVRDATANPTPALRDILVPLDGSRLAEDALPLAVELARRSGATLHLARVVPPFWQSSFVSVAPEAVYVGATDAATIDEQAEADARGYLAAVAQDFRAQGVPVTWEARFGRPADELIRLTETTDADLIVMATHGRGGVRRWALGSVTTALAQRSPIPVLAIPRGAGALRISEPDAELSATG